MELWLVVGQMVLALATFVLAGATYGIVRKTGKLVEATRTSAASAQQTIEEVRRDRELQYRPYISWRGYDLVRKDDKLLNPGKARVVNFGRGPVLHGLCCLAWREPTLNSVELATTLLFDLSPRSDTQPHELLLERRAGWQPDEDVAGNPVTTAPVRVAFCQDQLGTYYRFVPYEPSETWHEGQTERPQWVEFYQHHFTALKRQ